MRGALLDDWISYRQSRHGRYRPLTGRVQAWGKDTWRAYRLLVEEFGDPDLFTERERQRRDAVVMRFLDRLPRISALGTEYKHPYSILAHIAALVVDRRHNPASYPPPNKPNLDYADSAWERVKFYVERDLNVTSEDEESFTWASLRDSTATPATGSAPEASSPLGIPEVF
jgi:hypothetical protein